MAERNDYSLLNGGDSMGMSDSQYKGMLLDQLEGWQRVLKLAEIKPEDIAAVREEAKMQIAKIHKKLEI